MELYVEEFDMIGMVETWIDEKRWNGIKEHMPEEFIWKCEYTKKDKSYGRNHYRYKERNHGRRGRKDKGRYRGYTIQIREYTIQIRRVVLGEESWKMVTVYNGKDTKETMRKIKKLIPEEKEGNLVIGGDFNARIGERTIIWGDERDEIGRRSKDKVINGEGKKFLKEIEERGWDILNGNIEEGEII